MYDTSDDLARKFCKLLQHVLVVDASVRFAIFISGRLVSTVNQQVVTAMLATAADMLIWWLLHVAGWCGRIRIRR